MVMELWVGIVLMFGSAESQFKNSIHSISSPPFASVKLCQKSLEEQGMEIYFTRFAPQGWVLGNLFCVPLLQDYQIDLGKSVSNFHK